MKNILSAIALSVSVFAFSQDGIKFETSTFKDALAKAKKEKKLIFLDAYASWCGPCKLMAKNIFPLKNVGDYYNSHFVNTKLDMEKGEGIDLAKKYGVKAYPTYLFIDGDGKEVHRTLGYVEEKDFIQFAKDAEDPSKQMSKMIQKFEGGEKNPEFLKNLAGLVIYSDENLAGRVIARYFDSKKGTALDKDDVGLLMAGLKSTSSPTYLVFKDKKDEIYNLITPATYERINTSLLLNEAFTKNYDKDKKVLNEKQFMAEAEKLVGKESAEKYMNNQKISKALKAEDYATYQKLMLEKYKDVSNVSSDELNSIAWNFFEKIKDKQGLTAALGWAQESVKKNENSANTDTLANLYFKLGDKQNAKIWAEKAIELAKKTGEDYSETQKLLDSIK